MSTWPDSPRSRRTGPGSRGGRWHDPEYRRAYHRAWKLAHPEYRARDALRRHEAKRRGRLTRDRELVTATMQPWPQVPGRCWWCGRQLPVGSRRHRLTCSWACRGARWRWLGGRSPSRVGSQHHPGPRPP